MKEGDIALISLPQADGKSKLRPALLLKKMPAFNDFLVSGISSQIHQQIKDFDHLIDIQDNDFPQSGLKQSSLIRMNFLAVMNSSRMAGTIGKISVERHKYILKKLSDFKLSD